MRKMPFFLSVKLPRRGFVITIAIMLIALVAVALAALTTRISTTARQARQAAEQAQVEELIFAGMDLTRDANAQAAREIQLPGSLVEQGSKLRFVKSENSLEIEAIVGRVHLSQPAPTSPQPALPKTR